MLSYWILFIVGVILVFVKESGRKSTRQTFTSLEIVFVGALLSLMIGLRFEVGGDWATYVQHLQTIAYKDFLSVLTGSDPGYYILNWLSDRLGVGIWGVNLVCGVLFTIGLITFARTMPQPALVLVIAIPYLIIVVAMGYTRQGVAIGLVMIAMSKLQKGSFAAICFWTVLAVLFHKSALIIIPLAALASTRNRYISTISAAALFLILFYLFIYDDIDALVTGYANTYYQSEGALVRVLMNCFAAIVYLAIESRIPASSFQRKFWRYFAYSSLACLLALYLFNTSVIIDRLALYLIPLQLYTFGYLPSVMARSEKSKGLLVFGVCAYSALVQFVWLNYAANAAYWLPYRFYPLA